MATGAGTQTDPYIVSTLADLRTAAGTAGAYVEMDPDASTKILDLNGSATNPVTQRLDINCASLAGNGWRIRNLYFSSPSDNFLASTTTAVTQVSDLHFDNLVCNNVAKPLLSMANTTLTGCSFTGVKYFAAGVYLLAAGSSTHSMTCKSCTFAMQAQGSSISFGIANRCDFIDCNFMLDMPFTVEGGRRGNLFSYSGLEDCLMRGSITLSGTGNGGLLNITDGNQPMKNCFIAVEFTNTSEYIINLYPAKATATSCIVSSLIGTGITYYNGDNVQYVTAAQGKSAAYLNSVGFPVTAGV
ncbi:hypothetical protein [Ruminococcus sp.]|uniref:hypothetical protein n=1 Tax=Ruminococcus sp. TaxID=41978 RepID=UPI002637C3E0|nr:hypothetical protein [Ruminococcus sp.]MDD7556168.1 hypothetical protein [Ruminococcus sp.]